MICRAQSFSSSTRFKALRAERPIGGGPLADFGSYCLNAARYLYQAGPLEETTLNLSSVQK
jgi:hypothetical protein